MNDISTTAPITMRRLILSRPSFPRLEIGPSLAAMCSLVGDALTLAYVTPYTSLRRQPQAIAAYLMRSYGRGATALTAPSTMAGLVAGVSFMYLTAMLVKV